MWGLDKAKVGKMADELVEAREEKAKAERGCMRLQNRLKETVSSNGEVAKEGDGE